MKRRGFLTLMGAALAAPAGAIPAVVQREVRVVQNAYHAVSDVPAGWHRLSSGIIVQWGEADAGGVCVLHRALRTVLSANCVAADDDGALEPTAIVSMSSTQLHVSRPRACWMAIGF